MTFNGTSLRKFWCPQCLKQRLFRSLEFIESKEKKKYKTRDNQEIELFTEVCDPCKRKNFQKYFEPTKAEIKKVLKALHDDKPLKDKSLEEML